METYLWFVIVLGGAVDMLLLTGACALSGFPVERKRLLPAGVVGGLHAGAAATGQLYFLGNWYWRLVFMVLVCMVGFGLDRSTLRKGALYILLRLALDGVGMGVTQGGQWALGAGALGLCVICCVGFRGGFGKRYVPVEFTHKGKRISLTALYDTGNSLKDPLTGQSVMVVGPELAAELAGLTPQQLRTPSQSIRMLPGGRLIPYKTISNPGGMLLAMSVPDVRIGSWRGKCLLAFAPERFGSVDFQALTGG